jgi:hypothetical protein
LQALSDALASNLLEANDSLSLSTGELALLGLGIPQENPFGLLPPQQ